VLAANVPFETPKGYRLPDPFAFTFVDSALSCAKAARFELLRRRRQLGYAVTRRAFQIPLPYKKMTRTYYGLCAAIRLHPIYRQTRPLF
jgi:hypothetical protein